MFIFYFLGVGLPCRLIFCHFWLCEEAQCVYLRRRLGSQNLGAPTLCDSMEGTREHYAK